MFIFNEDKVIEFFCNIDDFCIEFSIFQKQFVLNKDIKPTNTPKLSQSEIITILVFYHESDYKNFKAYYKKFVVK